jgi:hypothetical protein
MATSQISGNHSTITLTAALYNNPVTVESGAYISGSLGQQNALLAPTSWVIDNYGKIAARGNGSNGVYLTAGGAIVNFGNIIALGNSGTLFEAGSGTDGVLLTAGGFVSNAAGGLIAAYVGVGAYGAAAATVENAGTIEGAAAYAKGYAVDFNATAANRLIVDPGAVFKGRVVANAAGSNTIELTDSHGGVGTLSGLGSQYQGFQAINVDAGAKWTVGGTLNGGAFVAANVTVTIAKGSAITADISTIYGTGSNPTIVNFGSVDGAAGTGVLLHAGGTVTNAGGGTIAAGMNGVYVDGGAGTVTNAGSISGAGAGVWLSAGGTVANQVGGVISGEFGVYLTAAGTVENAGTIVGKGGPSVKIKDSGTNRLILDPGAVFNGVVAAAAGGSDTIELSDKYGGVGKLSGLESQYQGFQTVDVDAGSKWTVGGTLDGAANVAANATLTVTKGSAITGARTAIYGTGSGATVVNFGSVDGASQTGVWLQARGTVTNAAGGTIASGLNGVYVDGGAGTVTNAGSISGIDTGVWLSAGGTVANQVGGMISGGVYLNAGGTVENAGTIAQTGFPSVAFYDNGTNRLIVDPGAVFHGSVAARAAGSNTLELSDKYGGVGKLSGLGSQYQGFQTLYVDAGANWTVGGTLDGVANVAANATLTVAKGSAITGAKTAIYGAGSGATVVNFGSVNGAGSTVVWLQAGGTVTNAGGGTIASSLNGIFVSDGSGTVTNAGSISGAQSVGVWLDDGGSVTNQAGGMISGDFGVYLTAAGTVENAGTIIATGAPSVDFNDTGTNRLIVDPGAVFNGVVVAKTAGSNTLELSDKYGAVGAISGLGSQYQGFQTLQFDAGAAWTVAGSKSGFAGVTIQGFAATDMLDLTDLPFATGETAKLVAGNVLDILSSRKVVLDAIQLSATDNFTGDVFRVATDGAGGTFVAIASPGTALWQGSTGGLWSNRLDWSNGVEPRLTTVNAFIDLSESAPYTVTDSVAASVHSLTIASANATLALSGRLIAAGGVTVTDGAIALSAGLITGPVSVGAGGKITGKGTITGAVTDNGLVEALGGLLDITGAVTGRGVLGIGSGSSLELGATANGVTFTAGTGTLILNVPADSFGAISGFAIGDIIDLKNKAANGFSYSGDTLTVTETVKTTTTTVATLTLAGSFAGEHFVVASDGARGTDIALAAGPAAIPGVGVAARQTALFSEAVAAHPSTLSAFPGLSALNGASYAALAAIAAPAHR